MEAIAPTALHRVGNLVHEVKHVDAVLSRVAELTTELVCRRLGIPTVKVRWLAPDRRDVRGETLPSNLSEIWVRAGQTVAATIETTAHECRHQWQLQPDQFRWLTPGLQTDAERETDAHHYGRRIRAELTKE